MIFHRTTWPGINFIFSHVFERKISRRKDVLGRQKGTMFFLGTIILCFLIFYFKRSLQFLIDQEVGT